MAIGMTTTTAEIDAFIESKRVKMEAAVIRALSKLGEECIIEVRSRSADASWSDDTGNLRSSVGYILLCDGEIMQASSFEVIKDGTEGAAEGRDFADNLAKKFNKGYVLIVVAGMHYAAYVEAMENKDVLASAQLFAESELPKMMLQLNARRAA